MDLEKYKEQFIKMSNDFGYGGKLDSLKGIDEFFPIMNEIRKDSGVIIFKLDGEREDNIYTFLASGKNLGEGGSIRVDTSDLEGGLSYVCVEYARIAWKWSQSN
ncbi:hypothetical protein HAHI6034_01815 [Hathewaya histolytica]|uniref:Uncharacterized protein n=1 Tax=Hathewaya histolytica TaxID=1498 RepID=A0A4V6KBZ9_HATHI|nr:hypothetical protein [Hathewaya histolytica]VTQ84347.1 Uncharacterised protein [Hathewaya histolytica]